MSRLILDNDFANLPSKTTPASGDTLIVADSEASDALKTIAIGDLPGGLGVEDYTVTEADVTAHEAALSITESQISDLSHFTPTDLLTDYSFTDNSTNWNTAFGWGDHASEGYITGYTVTEGDVTAHEDALSITASQVTDFDTEVANNSAVAANTAKVSYPGDASAAELNILDGATISTTELNRLDGVTSNVQTQLDAKPDAGDIPDALADLDTTVTGTQLNAIKSKIDNIEANADVTDTANVTAAGALMDSEVTNLAAVKAFDPDDYASALGADDNYVTDAEKVVIGNTSGTNTGDQTSVTGNAGTATKLATARTIAGVSFDGSANISLNNNAITNGAGYITDYTVTEGDVTAHEAALSITESQISDHGTYLEAGDAVMGTIVHGATAGTARPSGFDVVTWVGSVEPSNATDNDIWVNNST